MGPHLCCKQCKSLRLYCLPCVTSSASQCCCRILFSPSCCLKCCGCMKHSDKVFLPNAQSLGKVQTDDCDIIWKRAQEIVYEKKKIPGRDEEASETEVDLCINHLFNKSLQAEDVSQGALGDCWLLSAVASLTSQPSLIQNAFLTKSFNPRGKYKMKLWDPSSKQYVKISVDDYIPVHKDTGKPCFVSPNGNEMYTMIIEKVFAKFMGSYARIEGGYSLFALQALTGCPVHKFKINSETQEWKKLYMKVQRPAACDPIDVSFYVESEHIQGDDMYQMLSKLHDDGCILAASSEGVDTTIKEGRDEKEEGEKEEEGGEEEEKKKKGSSGGIVPGHAYTILKIYRPKMQLPGSKSIRLVKLRNPWGSFEWKGDWSDESDMWKKHPIIRFEMGFHDKKTREKKGENDGEFYMSWDDFLQHFRGVDVCYTKRDLSNLHMDAKEEYGCLGPFVGCIVGAGVAEADRDRDKDGDPGTGTTGTSRIEWYSDQGQDRLLMEQVLQGLRGGYFVELGASDGISISNTLALERSFGWEGLCIEPSLMYRDLLQSGRRCAKRGDVVTGRSGEVVTFIDQSDEQGEKRSSTSAETQTQTETQKHSLKESQSTTQETLLSLSTRPLKAPHTSAGLYSGIREEMQTYEVEGVFVHRVTRSLADILDEMHAPSHVDFLSLDTEGSEYDILSTFPFHRRSFGALLIEHNYEEKKRHATQLLLEAKGYIRVRCVVTDDLYVSLGVLAHYHIRVDPRSCEAISFHFLCSKELNAPAGRQECLSTGGPSGRYFRYPEREDVEPWQLEELRILQQRPSIICSILLDSCDREDGWAATTTSVRGEVSTSEPDLLKIPISSGSKCPVLEVPVPSGPPFVHRFTSTLSASEDIQLPQLCADYNLSSKECADLGHGVEDFVDEWLRSFTQMEVVRVAESMVSSWTMVGVDENST